MTKEPDWLTKSFPNQLIREGRTMEDPDFPTIAITYSLEEIAEIQVPTRRNAKNY